MIDKDEKGDYAVAEAALEILQQRFTNGILILSRFDPEAKISHFTHWNFGDHYASIGLIEKSHQIWMKRLAQETDKIVNPPSGELV
jgi:hypothetical protein